VIRPQGTGRGDCGGRRGGTETRGLGGGQVGLMGRAGKQNPLPICCGRGRDGGTDTGAHRISGGGPFIWHGRPGGAGGPLIRETGGGTLASLPRGNN